jgi:hypothetical protein
VEEMRNMQNCQKTWKRSYRIPRLRWEGNIRMGLRETGWESMDWIHLNLVRNLWQAFANMVMSLWVP